MLVPDTAIDDFKTDRKDIAPPLPMVMRLVPLLFYLSLLFLAVVGSLASMHAKFASDHRTSLLGRIEELKKEIEAIKTEKTALENEIQEATDLEAWVLASIPLQPLVVAIIESMAPQSEIVDFTLERDAETPSQLRIGLKLNTISDKQIEQTLEVIRGLNYREFNPTQTRVQGNLDYRASLLWQDPLANRQTPEERRAQTGATP
jgi:cell division protein FtsB